MKALYFILPIILIIGGFIGLAFKLPAMGWAILLGLLLYPPVTSSIGEKINNPEKDKDQ